MGPLAQPIPSTETSGALILCCAQLLPQAEGETEASGTARWAAKLWVLVR